MPGLSRPIAISLCALLLIAFAALSWCAIQTKSPTYDEPVHALAAWIDWHDGDFRLNPESPPLWQYWVALPLDGRAIDPEAHGSAFAAARMDVNAEWRFAHEALYNSPGLNVERFIARGRFMMLLVALMLGVMLATWANQLGGRLAAIVASTCFAFDPTFLAHASVIKNDVALAAVVLALAFSSWRIGRRLTIFNAAAFALACAGAMTIKFAGVMLLPIFALLIFGRALLPQAWTVFRSELTTRRRRILAGTALCLVAFLFSYAFVWSIYGLRFNAVPGADLPLNFDRVMKYTAINDLTARLGHRPSAQQVQQWTPGFVPSTVASLYRHRLLPEAWLVGFLYTFQTSLAHEAFCLGQYSLTGWWYYFPVAFILKSPIALLVALTATAAVGVSFKPHWTAKDHAWTTLCLALPPALFFLAAMRSNINIGLRHILPIYPFLFLAIALAATRLSTLRPRLARIALPILAVALLAEALIAFPNYIAFFNLAAGGSRGRLTLLGDSNLDWGQDLKPLAAWQAARPDVRLQVLYFGTAEPAFYGLASLDPTQPPRPGVIAVSATYLQGLYADPPTRALVAVLRRQEPLEVIGGTIYLYAWPPKQS